jgi:hypothetical protein
MARNDLPSPSAPNFPQRLREAVMTYLGRTGDPLDRGITLRDLIEGGIARLRDGYTAGQAATSGGALPIAPEVQAEEPDLTPPPTPTGFAVSAAISHVFIEHDSPLYLQGHGHLRTRVYGKTVAVGDPLPVFADAAEITQFTGTIHSHPSNPATTWRLWIKWESVDGVLSVSPAGGTNGLAVTTGQDVSKMVEAMTGAGKPFTVLTAPTVVGGVTFPAGIYATWAFIQDAQVTNAKIASLAVDTAQIANSAITTAKIGDTQITNAKIDTLDASKITAGFLSADRIAAGAISAAKIDSRGLSIKDAAGNIILAAGSPLAVGNISGLGTLATANNIAYVDITGAKPPSDADKTSANTAAAIANQGAFATLSQITSANASTYIADAAIGNAQIGGAIQSTDFSAGSAGWRIDKGGQAELNNGMFRGTVSAGTSPAVVGSSMTGSGAVLNPGGSFALGNASKNLSFDGSSLTMNGDLIVTGNLVNDAITESFAAVLTSQYSFTMCPGDPPHVILSGMIDSNGGPLYIHSKIEFLVNGFSVLVQLTVNGVVVREVLTAPNTAQTTYPKGWALDFEYVVNPGAGSNQVALRAVHAGGTGVCRTQSVSANDKTGLFVLALKR